MYAMANATVVVTRGTIPDPRTGTPIPAGTPVFTGPASISEDSNRYFDQATQTPRTIRTLQMLVSSAVDIHSGDYVTDSTRGFSYVVQDVMESYGLLFTPDKLCNLKRVG